MALLASVLALRQRDGLVAPIHVLTVDHDLRSGSAGEAAFVAGFCERHGINHAVLTWKGAKPSSAVAERARMMRRDLLVAECRARHVRQLLLAHTMDDVAETLLMRVKRGGLRGHASIAPATQISDIRVVRPFLSLHRSELRDALRRSEIPWVDDPTNDNVQYERPRMRRALWSMNRAGFPTDRIAAYAFLMGRWRTAMALQIARCIRTECKLVGSDVHLQTETLRQIPPIIAVEVLRELVRFVGGDAYMVDFSQAKDAIGKLNVVGGMGKAFSSGRCVLTPVKNGVWTISRALRDFPTSSVTAGQSVHWDGRFIVQLGATAHSAGEVRPASEAPLHGRPIVLPGTLPHEVTFRPRVLDGPVASFDEPVFNALEALFACQNR